jgi:hypothetical protein
MHAPDGARTDFGEVQVVIAGPECMVYFMASDLPGGNDRST